MKNQRIVAVLACQMKPNALRRSIESAFHAPYFRHRLQALTEEADMGLTRSINVLLVSAAFVFVMAMLFI
jgi:hypothetical protein